jgi:DUF4097 and DUF4098 domain-containing protein YvlB
MRTAYENVWHQQIRPRVAAGIWSALGNSVLLAAGLMLIASTSFAGEPIFQQTYPLAAGGSFLLENVNGSVQVEGWDRNEVEVRAMKLTTKSQADADGVKIDVENDPGQVAVRTRYPQGQSGEVAVEYHVFVPTRVLLSGVDTVNGSVRVSGVDGGGDLRSVNGNVEVVDSSGRFSAKTTNGNLRLELRRLSEGAPMDIETVNGSVTLGLPSDAHADLNVLNMNGSFSSELPITAKDGSPSGRVFRAKLGTGGGEILVRTVNGGIHLFLEGPRPS